MPKYLITGVTGFVGSHLAEACQKRGIPTVTIARSTSDLRWPKQFGCQVVVLHDRTRHMCTLEISQP